MIFFIIFFIIPLTEVFVFIQAGQEIGVFRTLLLCVLTAGIGGLLVKRQGLEVLFRGRQSMQQGMMPVEELFDGFCIVVAGAMLMTPGFVTDILGFSLLIPPVRRLLRHFVSQKMHFSAGPGYGSPDSPAPDRHTSRQPDVIDVDYQEIKEE